MADIYDLRADAEDEKLLDKHWDVLFAARRSLRYHDRRFAFFSRLNAITAFAGLVLTSALIGFFVIEVFEEWALWVKLLPAGIVTVLTGLNLVYGSALRAWTHADLRRRWIELEVFLLDGQPTAGMVEEARIRRLRIEADEPPMLRVLDVICHNELSRAEGQAEYQVKLGFWARVFAQWFDLRDPPPGERPA